MGLFGNSKNSEDYVYEGLAMLQQNKPKVAVNLFKKALKSDSKNISALYNQGLALNQMRKYQDAITCFDKVIDIDPNDAPSYNNRACLLYTSPSPRD